MENQNALVAPRSELVDQLLEHIVCFGGFTADFSSTDGDTLLVKIDNEGDREATIAIFDRVVAISIGSGGDGSAVIYREHRTTEELVNFIMSIIFD